MKASKLLEIIRENLKDYDIEYVRNKVTDDRYKDPLTKKLAKYNSETYDDIYGIDIVDDFEIKDALINNLKKDIGFYFDTYAGGDEETKYFTENISLYLALIAKKPLHPFSEDKKDDIFFTDGEFYCKGRAQYIHDKNTLCKYCVSKNMPFNMMF